MTTRQFAADINRTAKAARKYFKETQPAGEKIIDINWGLPYLAIYSGNDEYFFQGEGASELLEQAVSTSNKFNTNVENTLIWMAQSW
jgi:hypothetical protein